MPTPRYWTPEVIVEAVQHFISCYGRPPRYGEFYKRYGLPSRRLVDQRMRTWQEAIRQALCTKEEPS